MPQETKSSWTRGMTLNSQRRMKANLLSLSADYQVSRSKLCQGGGYDEAIRSDLTGEHTRGRANDKEETIDDASIVYEKARGTTTTSERDCTVRTAGLDPDPIGDSGTFLVVGTVTPEESPSTCTKSQTTREQELCLDIRSEITYLKDFYRARTQLERSHFGLEHQAPPGTLTKPWKMPLGESTRSFHLSLIIQQQTIHFRRNYRARTQLERSHLDLGNKSPFGTFTEPWKLPLGESTREFSLYLCIHSKITYFEGLGRAKLPKEPANWKESNLKQFGRFTLSEPTNPDRGSSSHALMFSNTHLKTTCCFRMPKTASMPAPLIGPRRSHLPYTDLPYLDQGAFNPQRLLSDPLRHESRHIQDLQTVPRHSSFGPKLSRLKPSRNLPYLARLLHKFTNGHIHLFCTISFCFLVLRML